MNQSSDSPRSPLGIVSVVIPVVLVLVLVLMQSLNHQSSMYRLVGVLSIFALGVGAGLGFAGLSRRVGGSRLPAIAGIVLSALMVLGLSVAIVKARTATGAASSAAENRSPDQ